jgi:hypothetical protein
MHRVQVIRNCGATPAPAYFRRMRRATADADVRFSYATQSTGPFSIQAPEEVAAGLASLLAASSFCPQKL